MITGFSVSVTLTVNEQVAEPHVLFAVMVTIVTPTLKLCPEPVPLPLPIVAPLNVYVKVGEGIPVVVAV